MRDYDETIKKLQEENFDLKLRIFLLEERCSKRTQIKEQESSEGYLVHQVCLTHYLYILRFFDLV